ncbi:hypothetical protein BDZ89DRAFT_739615 [Hymenopellis radicata]|nr:hypothetical protein BDZ89DRAFT_739615 [Hymenopellis radicata]
MFDLPTSSPPSRTVSSEIPIASYGDEVEPDSRDYTAIFEEEQPADMDTMSYEEEEVLNGRNDTSASNHSRTPYESRSSVHNEYNSSARQDSSASRLQYGDDFSSWIHVPSEDPDIPYIDTQDVVNENDFSEFSSWVDLPSASSAPRKPSSPLFRPLAKSDDVFSMSIASRNGASRLGFLKLPMPTPKPVKSFVPLPAPPTMRSIPLGTRQQPTTRYSPVQVPLIMKPDPSAVAMNDDRESADHVDARDVVLLGVW